MLDPLIILFGLGVGILVGLTGIGGGSLMTPMLILFAGIQPVVAIGTDLAYGAITKTLGGWRHLRMGNVDRGVASWLALGSAPGAIVGVFIVNQLHTTYGNDFDGPLLVCVAGALLVVGSTILLRATFAPQVVARERQTVEMTSRARVLAVTIGFVLGLLVGGTSVGSGALMGLALILVFRLAPHRVVGTDVVTAAILLWVAGLAHWVSGNVDLTLMVNILAGSLPGVVIGAALVNRVPARGLRPVLGCVLVGSAMAVLTKAGADVPVWTILALPVLAGVLSFALQRGRSGPGPGRHSQPRDPSRS